MHKQIKVFIGVPSQETWKSDFGMSLVHMIATVGQPLRDGSYIQSCRLWNSKGSILPKLRSTLVRQALEGDFSHILFIDSDMTFPAETLHRLLSHKKAVVACNCAVKAIPSSPTARLRYGETGVGVPLYSAPDDFGLKQVWRVGTGIMLVETRVFQNLAEPWFPIHWNPETQDYTGEDWAFCEKLDKHGIPIYVDMQLSKHIGHVGSFTYEHKHVEIKDGHGNGRFDGKLAGVRHSYEFGVSAPRDDAYEEYEAAGSRAKS